MKKSRIVTLLTQALAGLELKVRYQERGINGLGNGPGVINGLVVDEDKHNAYLKSQEVCEDPVETLKHLLQILECDVNQKILEETL